MAGLIEYALNGFKVGEPEKKKGKLIATVIGVVGGTFLGSIARDIIPVGDPRILVFGGAAVGGLYGFFWLSNTTSFLIQASEFFPGAS